MRIETESLLPRHFAVPEVAERSGGVVVHIQQAEAVNDAFWRQVVGVPDEQSENISKSGC